jgi:hypothetical protein
MPVLSARVRVAFDEPVESSAARPYAIRGNAQQMRAEIAKWEDLGVEHLAIWPVGESIDVFVAAAERFTRSVVD